MKSTENTGPLSSVMSAKISRGKVNTCTEVLGFTVASLTMTKQMNTLGPSDLSATDLNNTKVSKEFSETDPPYRFH